MIQQYHFLVFIQKNYNHELEETSACPSLLQLFKQPKCPSADEQPKKMWHIHAMGC